MSTFIDPSISGYYWVEQKLHAFSEAWVFGNLQ